MSGSWDQFADALSFAVSCVEGDADPLNERERADGNQYVLRILAAVAQSATIRLDPDRPAFLTMLDTVRFLGAAGPDIDYDVAAVRPGGRYRITGRRGEASYVGIAVYAGAGASGATAIVLSVDVDELSAPDGSFVYEFEHPESARVIVRQYFHDRSIQKRGEWAIERVDGSAAPMPSYMSSPELEARVAGAAASLRWNAQLNRLWTPELRDRPNIFVRQTSHEIVAAVPNPDVVYSTAWWRRSPDEAVVIDFTPPDARYWSLQLCDRWFQCFPDRRAGIHDRQVVRNADGSVRIVLCDGDPGVPNWLDTCGHTVGTAFFRWLHSDIASQPTCTVVKRDQLA